MADEKKVEDKVFRVIEEGIDLVFNFGKRAVTEGLKEVFEIKTGDPVKDEAEVATRMKRLKREAKARMRDLVDGLWKDDDDKGPPDKKDKVDP
ncbi:MAG: hypothetical protein AAB575_02105 [Patescibacteria group bacterium]